MDVNKNAHFSRKKTSFLKAKWYFVVKIKTFGTFVYISMFVVIFWIFGYVKWRIWKKNLLCQQLHQEKYFWPLHHYFLSHWFQSQIRFRHLLTQSLGFEPSHTEAAEQMNFCHVNLSIYLKFI